jgi:hypothetical protein
METIDTRYAHNITLLRYDPWTQSYSPWLDMQFLHNSWLEFNESHQYKEEMRVHRFVSARPFNLE